MSLRDLLSCSSQHINPSGRTNCRPCTWLQVATAGQTGRIQPSAVRSKIQQTSNTTKWDILPLRRPVSRWGPDRHGSAPPSWYEADGPMWRPPPRDARCWLKSEPVFLMGGCLSLAQRTLREWRIPAAFNAVGSFRDTLSQDVQAPLAGRTKNDRVPSASNIRKLCSPASWGKES